MLEIILFCLGLFLTLSAILVCQPDSPYTNKYNIVGSIMVFIGVCFILIPRLVVILK